MKENEQDQDRVTGGHAQEEEGHALGHAEDLGHGTKGRGGQSRVVGGHAPETENQG